MKVLTDSVLSRQFKKYGLPHDGMLLHTFSTLYRTMQVQLTVPGTYYQSSTVCDSYEIWQENVKCDLKRKKMARIFINAF